MDLRVTDGQGFSMFGGWNHFTGTVPAVPYASHRPNTEASLQARTDRFTGLLEYEGRLHYKDADFSSLIDPRTYASFDGVFRMPSIAPSAIVTAPFTFDAGFSFGICCDGLTRAGHQFVGAGMATIQLRPSTLEPSLWVIDSIRYEFAAADPVPEPGTLLLVGLGVAGVARKVRSMRQAQHTPDRR